MREVGVFFFNTRFVKCIGLTPSLTWSIHQKTMIHGTDVSSCLTYVREHSQWSYNIRVYPGISFHCALIKTAIRMIRWADGYLTNQLLYYLYWDENSDEKTTEEYSQTNWTFSRQRICISHTVWFDFLSWLFLYFCFHPVRELHREFLRAGADVMQALTFYASDDKLSNRGNKASANLGVSFSLSVNDKGGGGGGGWSVTMIFWRKKCRLNLITYRGCCERCWAALSIHLITFCYTNRRNIL